MRRTVSLSAMFTVGLLMVGGAVGAAELQIGDQAPDFKLQGSDGKTYHLADFKGESPVLLMWFPKAFTGG